MCLPPGVNSSPQANSGAVKSAARGKLPFRFGRQFLAGPLGIGFGIAICDMHNRMIVEPADGAARPVGPAPIGAEFEFPPLRPVAQINRMLRRRENQRAGFEHVRQSARIVLWIGRDFGKRDIAGGV